VDSNAGRAKKKLMTLYLDEDELGEITVAASLMGMQRQSWARSAILKASILVLEERLDKRAVARRIVVRTSKKGEVKG